MSYSHLHNCQRIYVSPLFLRISFFPQKWYIRHVSTQQLFSFVLFFSLLDIDRRCGARIQFQSFPEHHLEIKGNSRHVVGWTAVCFGWIESYPSMIQSQPKKKKNYRSNDPLDKTNCLCRMHGEARGRPKLFHIDVIIPLNQDGTQSHYLCIYIARPCNKAVLHQFSTMCSFAVNSKAQVACRGDDRPSFSFLWLVGMTH